MKRINSFIAATMAILLMTLAGCKKNEIESEPADGLPFVGKRMVLSSFIMDPAVDFDGDGKVDPDLMVFLPDCEKDNVMIFEKGGRLSGDNGAKRCDDDSPGQGNTGSWTYDEQTKMLRIVDGDDNTDISELKVIEASSKTLKAQVEVEEDGFVIKAIMTWKAL